MIDCLHVPASIALASVSVLIVAPIVMKKLMTMVSLAPDFFSEKTQNAPKS